MVLKARGRSTIYSTIHLEKFLTKKNYVRPFHQLDTFRRFNVARDDLDKVDVVAERLRRSTRNRLGLSRVGSSPADVELLLFASTMQ